MCPDLTLSKCIFLLLHKTFILASTSGNAEKVTGETEGIDRGAVMQLL